MHSLQVLQVVLSESLGIILQPPPGPNEPVFACIKTILILNLLLELAKTGRPIDLVERFLAGHTHDKEFFKAIALRALWRSNTG